VCDHHISGDAAMMEESYSPLVADDVQPIGRYSTGSAPKGDRRLPAFVPRRSAVVDEMRARGVCTECDGTGIAWGSKCSYCNGSGLLPT